MLHVTVCKRVRYVVLYSIRDRVSLCRVTACKGKLLHVAACQAGWDHVGCYSLEG